MIIEIRPPSTLERRGIERVVFELSSVAVWVIVNIEEVPTYFLVVQQADKPGNPWGVPAGKATEGDNTAKEVGIRELREETGITVNPDNLRYLDWAWKHHGAEKGHLIYGVSVDINDIGIKASQTLIDGTVIFEPPDGVNREEVSQLALVPLELAFKSNILNDNPYHSQETYLGLTSLRRAGIVHGRFKLEIDPYLFDE